MITYFSEQVKVPFLKKRQINTWIKFIVEKYEKKIGEIAFIFCNNEKILEVNRQYLQHDYYTDIITFDYSENKLLSGDIFISLDMISAHADEFDVTFEQELCRVLIHGVLHLCGQKDSSASERAEMTRKENEALEILLQIFPK